MKPVQNDMCNNIKLYTYKGNVHLSLGDGSWCIMDDKDLIEILNHVPLKKIHKKYGRYKRLVWSKPNETT